jgi:hypothetical protein
MQSWTASPPHIGIGNSGSSGCGTTRMMQRQELPAPSELLNPSGFLPFLKNCHFCPIRVQKWTDVATNYRQ